MKLTGEVVEVADLSADDRGEMLDLMNRHYHNVCPRAFAVDLAEKQWVIVVRDDRGRMQGFSTQMVLDVVVEGRPIKALFSGDTIVDRQHWGDRALPQAGGRLALSLADEWPETELYWFLISQSFRTYRFLPVFFREFYPRFDVPTPPAMRHVIDALAEKKLGAQYDPVAGVVRLQSYKLRAGMADPTPKRREDPHIRYFIDRNPGHVAGEELCCIARLSRKNFTPAALRVL
jgi:hypothetical protein